MKSKLFLKFAAIVSSIVLVALFIAYRAGALDRTDRPHEEIPKIFSSSKSAVILESPSEQPAAELTDETAPAPPPTAPEQPLPIIFGGSKSLMIVPPDEAPEVAQMLEPQ